LKSRRVSQRDRALGRLRTERRERGLDTRLNTPDYVDSQVFSCPYCEQHSIRIEVIDSDEENDFTYKVSCENPTCDSNRVISSPFRREAIDIYHNIFDESRA
jgi:transcription elongation factor Elf1